MSYLDRFTRYGSPSEDAEIRTFHYFRRPDKISTAEDVALYDKSAADMLKECNALIAFIQEYRQALAARYSQLETMPYSDTLKIDRTVSYDNHKYYHITITRRYEDGTEQEIFRENFTGKDRRDALKRFDELQKQRPGITAVKDIEKKSWER